MTKLEYRIDLNDPWIGWATCLLYPEIQMKILEQIRILEELEQKFNDLENGGEKSI